MPVAALFSAMRLDHYSGYSKGLTGIAERVRIDLLQSAQWFAVIGHAFLKKHLLSFQLGDALLIGCDHAACAGFDDAVQQGFNLLLSLVDIFLDRLGRVSRLSQACIPDVAEHGLCKLEQPFGRL